MSPLLIGLIVGGVILLFFIAIYNRLVSLNIETKNAWSQIDVQLKRRYDLIPNLVETVKGYAKHESETLEKVIKARNMSLGATTVADKAAAENQLTGALKTLFAVSEAYPDLKANTNFQALQEELTATENRIGYTRQHYNDAASSYNTSLQSFPNNIVGGMFGFKAAEFFTLDPAEAAAARQAPQVKF